MSCANSAPDDLCEFPNICKKTTVYGQIILRSGTIDVEHGKTPVSKQRIEKNGGNGSHDMQITMSTAMSMSVRVFYVARITVEGFHSNVTAYIMLFIWV